MRAGATDDNDDDDDDEDDEDEDDASTPLLTLALADMQLAFKFMHTRPKG